MSRYDGNIFPVRFGSSGLHTDEPHFILPPDALTRAVNVSVENGKILKEGGSTKWNTGALPAGIVRGYDWWPDEITQKLIVVCKDGKVYSFKDRENFSEITASGGAPATLNVSALCSIVPGGSESAGNNRKLFIMTGNDPVQIIDGDASVRRDLEKPTADWSGSDYPFFAVPHRNRLWFFGNRNDPHRAYATLTTDHEDLTTTPLQFSIYPGDSEKLMSGIVYKGRLFFVKYPENIYFLDDSQSLTANWRILKLNEGFGAASPRSLVPVLDDVLLANNYGSITSIIATDTLGDIKSGDLFSRMGAEEYVKEEISRSDIFERDMLYYGEKKTVLVAYRSAGGIKNDRICRIDFRKEKPVITWSDKDQPNCLGFMKDVNKVSKPFYGADDGYIYMLDQADFNVGGNAYKGEFRTPNLDFGRGNLLTAELNKNFDHLEVIYEPTGDFTLKCDYYIDLRFMDTLEFNLKGNSELDSIELDDTIEGRLATKAQLSERVPLPGSGRRINFHFYNEENGESFIVNGFNVYYQESGTQQLEKE